MKPPVRTSLIIASYNQPRSLALALEAVAGQTQAADEIIIADDGSQHPTLEVIEQCQARFSLPIKAVITQEDRGFRKCVALNKAILQSTGQQLLFLDGDVLVPPYWIARHTQSYCPMGYATSYYVRLSVDQSRAIGGSGLSQLDWRDYLAGTRRILPRFRFNYRIFRRYLKDRRGIFFGYRDRPEMHGGNFSVDRGLLFGVNGFDERYVGFGGLDVDLRNRMNNFGGRPTSLIYRALALHLHHGLESDEPNPRLVKNRQPVQQSVYDSSRENLWAAAGLTARMAADRPQTGSGDFEYASRCA